MLGSFRVYDGIQQETGCSGDEGDFRKGVLTSK